MSTTLVKPAEVERKWYLLDAAGKSLGHVAAEAAVLLRGKQKVNYTPNDYVGGLMYLCQNKRGTLIDMKYLDDVRVDLHYAMPLRCV